jgi:transcriptional regulator GlxA family with amidase domain
MTDMLDVAGPQYEDGDVTNERIAQRCGFGEPDTLRRAFLRPFGVAPPEYLSRFHSSHPLRADSAPSKQ